MVADSGLDIALPGHDPVNHPSHYTRGGIETIDFIEAKQFNYRIGNAVKYLTRYRDKSNPVEDLKKARWYIEREIAALEQERYHACPPSPAPASLAALREAEREALEALDQAIRDFGGWSSVDNRQAVEDFRILYWDAVVARVRAECAAERQQTFEAAHVTVLPEGGRGP